MITYFLWGLLVLNIEYVYKAIGQDPEVTVLATKFVHVMYPCYFIETVANVYNTAFAMSCRVMHYMFISLLIGSILYLSLTYYFQYVLDWGFDGICWATGIMLVSRGCIAVGCVKFGGRFPTFPDV